MAFKGGCLNAWKIIERSSVTFWPGVTCIVGVKFVFIGTVCDSNVWLENCKETPVLPKIDHLPWNWQEDWGSPRSSCLAVVSLLPWTGIHANDQIADYLSNKQTDQSCNSEPKCMTSWQITQFSIQLDILDLQNTQKRYETIHIKKKKKNLNKCIPCEPMTLLTTTFVLFNSAAINDRKEARPRETTMEKLNAKPYWCFSIGGECSLGGGLKVEKTGNKAWNLLKRKGKYSLLLV